MSRPSVPSFPSVLSVLFLLCLTACTSPIQLQNSQRLMARPDFPAARAAAPEFTRDALKTIDQLEYQLERK